MELEPRRSQLGQVRENVFESTERATAGNGSFKRVVRLTIADHRGELREVVVTFTRVDRVYSATVVGRLEIATDILSVPHRVAVQVELAGLRVDEPRRESAVVLEGLAKLVEVNPV